MIAENDSKLTKVLTDLVTDKFGYFNSCDAKAHCNKDVTGEACTTAGSDCGYGLSCTKIGENLQCVGTKESTGKWCAENPKE